MIRQAPNLVSTNLMDIDFSGLHPSRFTNLVVMNLIIISIISNARPSLGANLLPLGGRNFGISFCTDD